VNTKQSILRFNAMHTQRIFKTKANLFSKIQLLVDIIIVELALLLCVLIKGVHDYSNYYYLFVLIPLLVVLVYSNSSVYDRHKGRISQVMNISFAWSKVVAVILALAFVSKTSGELSRQVIISWFIITAPMQILIHFLGNAYFRASMKREIIPSIMVGNSEIGAYLAKYINEDEWAAHKIIGVVSEDDAEDDAWLAAGLPRLGSKNALRSLIEDKGVKRVYFALPLNTSDQVREMQLDLVDLNVDIVWVPDITGMHMMNPSIKEVGGVPVYYLSESPMTDGAMLSKLLMDKVLTALFLVVLSPLMVGIACAIKLTSAGPIFFRQERHGLDGKIIRIFKFRSMKMHQEAKGEVSQAVKNDSRLTSIGGFLRKTSADELPQLFNVLTGDMSLVGPRPHAKEHNYFYTGKINAYMSRHRILPGITGLAQVNGCRGETDTLEKMEKRVEYDLSYINNWSIWLDVRILIKTAYTLFSKQAY